MVKSISIVLFSFYIAALAVLPCGDLDDCNHVAIEHSLEDLTHSSNHENDIEDCSPFCVCNCCGQTLVFQQVNLEFAELFPSEIDADKSFQLTYSISEIFYPIWQPPKIS